jgi:hypothetical protein
MFRSHLLRSLVVCGAASLVLSASGCGVISGVKNFAGKVGVLRDLSGKLKDSEKLTFTAVYTVSGHKPVTLANQPPRTAVRAGTTTFVSGPSGNFLCQTAKRPATCEKTPANSATGMEALGAGQGFVSPQLAIGVLAAAALLPNAKVEESTRSIAGRNSTCAKVTGVDNVPIDDSTVTEFTVCITDDGILGSFQGALKNGKAIKMELTKFSTTVAAGAFALPHGAKVVDMASPSA